MGKAGAPGPLPSALPGLWWHAGGPSTADPAPLFCFSEAPVSLSHTPSVRRLSQLALPHPPPTTPGPPLQAGQASPSLERAPCLPDLDTREGTGRHTASVHTRCPPLTRVPHRCQAHLTIRPCPLKPNQELEARAGRVQTRGGGSGQGGVGWRLRTTGLCKQASSRSGESPGPHQTSLTEQLPRVAIRNALFFF